MGFEETNDTKEQDEYLSFKNISLRNYQTEVLEKAKNQNTVIYLPSGSGKTLIAVQILASRSNEIKRPYHEGGKRAFFIATTRIMTYQLYKVLRTLTKFKVAYFTGDMKIDTWNWQKWILQFEENHVLVMTGEILKQLLQFQYIKPANISLIVLDECHHAVADHPYRLILQYVSDESYFSEAPLLLGLSAVLLNSRPKKNQILPLIDSLENAFKGKVITTYTSFKADPTERIVYYKEVSCSCCPEIAIQLYDNIINVMNSVILKASKNDIIPEEGKEFKNRDKAKCIRNSLIQSKGHFEDLGIFGGSISALFFIILFEKYRLLSQDPSEIQILIYACTELNKIRHILVKIMGEEESGASIKFFSSSKVQQLLSVIKEMNEYFKDNYFSSIVFVHQRATAIVLAFLLERLSVVDAEYSFMKSNFVIGTSMLVKDSFYSKSKTEDIVKQFASRSFNVLVATNLLEEGIDICFCSVVISFDFPKTYSSFYQSRGRARNRKSFYYLILSEEERNEKLNILNDYKILEEELFKVTCNDNYEYEKDLEESLDILNTSEKSENVLDGPTAIKIVYKYCSKLPQDRFSFLSPVSWYVEVAEKKKAFIQLPSNCPLRDIIEGEVKENKKMAKRSVFLTTLKKLYEIGELDRNMNPKSFETRAEDYNQLFPHFKTENISKSLPQPGTKSRKQMYKVKCAEALSNCLPRPGIKAYVHVIDLTVAFEKPEVFRRAAIYDILQTPITFAIISSKKLTRIFQFPLFIELGQINCDLLVNYDEIILTESELNDIKMCHFMLFKKVIRITKSFQVFDSRNKDNSFFIVPVEKNEVNHFVLNWDLIRCDFCKNSNSALVSYNPTSSWKEKRTFDGIYNQNIGEKNSNCLVPLGALNGRTLWSVNQDQNDEGPKFIMTETDYKYFVIFPNYREQEPPQCYIVNKFCNDMSPLTPFPKACFENYLTYYREKYLIEITNSKQPLLRVSALYNCSNFSRPRTRKSHRAREKVLEYDEHLIPELCDVIPFDRRYWVKALLLPTVLHRIQHVYCVEEFRRKILSETGLGLGITESYWKPLEIVKTCMNEEEENKFDPFINSTDKILLPLSKLKDKFQVSEESILDPERHMYDIGLCDLEFYVNSLKEMDEEFSTQQTLPKKSFEFEDLITEENISIPALEILRKDTNSQGPDLALLVQASTSKSANDIVDYERLEILGDSYLKFATTLFLFRNYTENEGILSSLKGKIVGNRNLLYCGLEKGIQNVINVTDFVPLSDWNPPLFYIPERFVDGIIANNADPAVLCHFDISVEEQFSGVLSENTFKTVIKRKAVIVDFKNEEIIAKFEKCCGIPTSPLLPFKTLDDKTISDCVEAFIGAYLLTLGLSGAFEFLSWLGILPKIKGSYSELIEKPHRFCLLGPQNDLLVMNLLNQVLYTELENTLNYRFENKGLLLEALTHPSYIKNRITNCYQRLEFLGDAVLDFLVTAYIYENCGNLKPGQVSDIRSSIVNNITFACFTVRYGFHKYLLYFSDGLTKSILDFVSFQINRNHAIDDNVLILLEENECLIAEAIRVPKALGDVFESLAGAIYLDSGNSLESVWKVYYKLMKHEIDTFVETVPKTTVRLLQEVCGDKPYYETRVIDTKVKVLCSVYYESREIKGHGFGTNKKEAKRSAAKVVLNKILTLKK